MRSLGCFASCARHTGLSIADGGTARLSAGYATRRCRGTDAEGQESDEAERGRNIDLDPGVSGVRSAPEIALARFAGSVIIFHR